MRKRGNLTSTDRKLIEIVKMIMEVSEESVQDIYVYVKKLYDKEAKDAKE